ncbi:MAG TPA: hypothetical protein VL197_11535 [Nitrospirota bacterium]|nr:hypothetical protein [Nitrospirota bacterium]
MLRREVLIILIMIALAFVLPYQPVQATPSTIDAIKSCGALLWGCDIAGKRTALRLDP